jgi:hypothetical protein
MKKKYQNKSLIIIFAFLMIANKFVIAEQGIEDFEPVLLNDLHQVRGLGGVLDVINNNHLEAILTDNNASNNVSGSNIIDGGSFNQASGVFSIIQNTGNNVIIQDSTIITVTITPN